MFDRPYIGAVSELCRVWDSLGDTVVDEHGQPAHRHHSEWHEAVAKSLTDNVVGNVGQQWHLLAKLKASQSKPVHHVPLVIGPGGAVGRDKAALECKRMLECESDNAERAAAARRCWPLVSNTTVRCILRTNPARL